MDNNAASLLRPQQNAVLPENRELLNNTGAAGEVTDPTENNKYTACHAVIDLPELLESIILFLPFKDQLRALRISKTFKGVIDNSVKIQRELFLLPVPYTGPPLGAVFKPDGSEDETHYLHVEVNPILVAGGRPDCERQCPAMDGVNILWTGDAVCKEKLDRPSILSRMVLTRPAMPVRWNMVCIDGGHEDMKVGESKINTMGEVKLAEALAMEKYGVYEDDSEPNVTEWKLLFPGGLRFYLNGEPWNGATDEQRAEWAPF